MLYNEAFATLQRLGLRQVHANQPSSTLLNDNPILSSYYWNSCLPSPRSSFVRPLSSFERYALDYNPFSYQYNPYMSSLSSIPSPHSSLGYQPYQETPYSSPNSWIQPARTPFASPNSASNLYQGCISTPMTRPSCTTPAPPSQSKEENTGSEKLFKPYI